MTFPASCSDTGVGSWRGQEATLQTGRRHCLWGEGALHTLATIAKAVVWKSFLYQAWVFSGLRQDCQHEQELGKHSLLRCWQGWKWLPRCQQWCGGKNDNFKYALDIVTPPPRIYPRGRRRKYVSLYVQNAFLPIYSFIWCLECARHSSCHISGCNRVLPWMLLSLVGREPIK